jgi:uncharacterized protein (TIGR02284 family)
MSSLIASLNRCIEVCMDSQRAYGVAAAMVRAPSLKALFQSRADERARFVLDLQVAVCKTGGFPVNQGSLKGAVRRRWMDIEQSIEPTHDDYRVMADLVREERTTLDGYNAAMPQTKTDELPEDVRVMVREHRGAFQLALADLSKHLAA